MTASVISFALGLTIFLFGMSRLETGIHDASRARLQQWMVRRTHTAFGSAISGIFTTAILQSSSMVSLLVLAFASAGILPLYNAIGVILGANLGTTFTGWIVTLIGFKLELQQLAIPLMGSGALLQMLYKHDTRKRALGIALFGLGLLIFGLNIMKDGVANIPEQWDISVLSGHSSITYLIAGTLIAGLIQSSSATMMIVLSALYSQIITLPDAAALVIGADLGTTSTTILGSITGNRIKKQLALAHFIFNLVVDALAFVVLLPLLPTLLQWVMISDPLYGLVAFHSLFNLIGLIIFLPFLPLFSRWIEQRFISLNTALPPLLSIPAQVPDAAIAALNQHIRALLVEVITLNMRNLHIRTETLLIDKTIAEPLALSANSKQHFEERYEAIKNQEGTIVQFAIRLQQQPLDTGQAATISKLLQITRAVVYSAKTLKDIRQDIADLRHSDELKIIDIYKTHQQYHRSFYTDLSKLFLTEHPQDYLAEQCQRLKNINDAYHKQLDNKTLELAQSQTVNGESTSTLFNINREIHHSAKSLLTALDYWIDLSNKASVA